MIYPYGMSANAPVGTPTIIYNVLGREQDLASIPFSESLRFKNLKAGEVVFGSPESGSFIKFDEDGNIIIECKNDETVNITGAATINVTGDVDLTADNVNIDANQVNLGSGGAKIARQGDAVGPDPLAPANLIILGGGINTSL